MRNWAHEDGGQVARLTAWHAGQLVSLVRNTDAPLEPFALTYAALALVCYCHAATGSSAPLAGQSGAIALDRLVNRSDADVAHWIATGERDATLDDVGSLSAPGAPEMLLRLCGGRLGQLKVWRVGELLGGTLLLLAKGEREAIVGEDRIKVET